MKCIDPTWLLAHRRAVICFLGVVQQQFSCLNYCSFHFVPLLFVLHEQILTSTLNIVNLSKPFEVCYCSFELLYLLMGSLVQSTCFNNGEIHFRHFLQPFLYKISLPLSVGRASTSAKHLNLYSVAILAWHFWWDNFVWHVTVKKNRVSWLL